VQKKVPPYVIFSDATLRDLARQRPTRADSLAQVFGIGRKRQEEFGPTVMATIAAWCRQHHLSTDVNARPAVVSVSEKKRVPSSTAANYTELFQKQMPIEDICRQLNRSAGTVIQQLENYVRTNRVTDIDVWVPRSIQIRVIQAIEKTGNERLKPLFELLNSEVSYDQLRLVSALWDARQDT
jgi:ATP-dependent DNA helicase RecQ